eukprot:7605843-Karenia_brevis.AAC.1
MQSRMQNLHRRPRSKKSPKLRQILCQAMVLTIELEAQEMDLISLSQMLVISQTKQQSGRKHMTLQERGSN